MAQNNVISWCVTKDNFQIYSAYVLATIPDYIKEDITMLKRYGSKQSHDDFYQVRWLSDRFKVSYLRYNAVVVNTTLIAVVVT